MKLQDIKFSPYDQDCSWYSLRAIISKEDSAAVQAELAEQAIHQMEDRHNTKIFAINPKTIVEDSGFGKHLCHSEQYRIMNHGSKKFDEIRHIIQVY